jgi:cell filamentation protein
VNAYIDPATRTHFNKLGITDRSQLAKVEYAITDLRIAELQLQPIPGRFDLDHFRKVHHHIFQDLYDWAGKERTINFSKRNPAQPGWRSVFAKHTDIAQIAESVATDLKDWTYLQGLDPPEFAKKLAMTYVKINYMHAFPEGNGRSTQTMLSQLAREAGYRLDFDKVAPADWNTAAARSMPQVNLHEPALRRPEDTRPIHRVFRAIASPLQVREIEKTLAPRGKTPGFDR